MFKPVMRFWMVTALILCTAYFAIQRKMHPQVSYNSIVDRVQHPLDTRLRYKLGNIDPRFNITDEQLKILLQQAADIWQQGTMQSLFVYDPNAQLQINLIYDERQAESTARKNEVKIIENTQQYTQSENQKIQLIEQQLAQAKYQLEQYQQGYQTKIVHYNQMIQGINQNQSTLTDAARTQLDHYKKQLQLEQSELQQRINQFNQRVEQLHQQIQNLNMVNQQLNQSVNNFNQKFKPRQFDKGVFNGKEINIYEFGSDADLRLTLAHELGHALGLGHHQDPEALMFPIMKEQNLNNFKLRHADIELLNSRH